MGKTIISISLSPQDIKNATKTAETYKKDLQQKVALLMQTVVDNGAELARAKVVQMNAVLSGELATSIKGVYDPASHIGVIYTDCPHAVFVEFGTGAVGAGSPHPDLQGWKYDVSAHGEAGWWYLGDDGDWHWTKGMPSRPFMWETENELPQIIKAAAKAVFG